MAEEGGGDIHTMSRLAQELLDQSSEADPDHETKKHIAKGVLDIENWMQNARTAHDSHDQTAPIDEDEKLDELAELGLHIFALRRAGFSSDKIREVMEDAIKVYDASQVNKKG